eukprot:PITA_03314
MTGMLNIAEPSNYYEASKSFEWKEAMKEEYESIIKNNTWDLVKLPHDKQPIGCRWLFKMKFKANGSIDKHKTMLVAIGYSQKEGYTDFDWAGNLDDIRSITCYAFSIGFEVISWCSKKQHTVALSSAKAEYQAMCAAACEVVWLCKLLQDAGEEQIEATVINCDNQHSIKLAYNPVFHKNTKHIDTQFHFVREKVQSKEICVEYCNSCDNMADIFTKPLGRLKFELFRDILGVFKNPFSIKGEC